MVDFGALVRKLVLSDEIILESIRLREFPLLAQKFGYDGVTELLKSGRLRILCDALTVAQIGQFGARTNGPVLPLGSYSFTTIRPSDQKDYVHAALQIINTAGLRDKQAQRLRKLVAESLVATPDERGQQTISALYWDLEHNVPALKASVAMATKQHFGITIEPESFDLRLERLNEHDWRAETDLGARARLDTEQSHRAVEHGLLGVGGLNMRVEYMERYEALVGFKADELPLFDEKLSFLARQFVPGAQEERFERVRELVGLPDVDPDPAVHDVDMGRLLEITEDAEVREFRRWLHGIDSLTDDQVAAEVHRIRDLIGGAVRSRPGKALRLATTAGLGVVALPVGLVLSAGDTFLTERLVPEPGATAFLSRLYPSVFPDR